MSLQMPTCDDRPIWDVWQALPPGGRIYLHEMLLDDTGDGPRTTAAFSALMLANTRGRQFTFGQLKVCQRSRFALAACLESCYSTAAL